MALAIEFSPLLKWSIVEGLLGERQKEERDRKRKEERERKRREREKN